jgi:hypothetical protein
MILNPKKEKTVTNEFDQQNANPSNFASTPKPGSTRGRRKMTDRTISEPEKGCPLLEFPRSDDMAFHYRKVQQALLGDLSEDLDHVLQWLRRFGPDSGRLESFATNISMNAIALVSTLALSRDSSEEPDLFDLMSRAGILIHLLRRDDDAGAR